MTDVHCHVRWQDYDIDDWVKHFTRIGVDRVWALAWESWWRRVRGEYELPSSDVAEAAARYPDLFVPFCSIDPREADFDARFDYYVEQGFRGFGEMKLRLRIDNDDVQRIYARCGEVGWPVLFHIDRHLQPGGQWYLANVERLEPMLRKYPNTQFIGHGPGWWAEISGDADEDLEAYPKGPVTEGGRLPRLLGEYDNLYADISAGSGHNALSRDPEFGRQFVIDFADRLMYGTDNHDTKHIELLRAMDLPEAVFEKVTEGNARRLIP
ncbi:MAG: amidohydrolase family protein [Armatimonadota bacterium]